jgi:hypothetical protein
MFYGVFSAILWIVDKYTLVCTMTGHAKQSMGLHLYFLQLLNLGFCIQKLKWDVGSGDDNRDFAEYAIQRIRGNEGSGLDYF